MSDAGSARPAPEAPAQEKAPPFVLVTWMPQGVHLQTNLNDTILMLGLLEEGKFAIKLRNVERKGELVKPNGFAQDILRKMGRG